MIVLGVMLGGAAGALARYFVDEVVTRRTGGPFPYGVLLINVTGAALLGFLTGLAMYHSFPDEPEAVLGSGFCGGYTTFSTFAVNTITHAESGDRRGAVINVAANFVLGTAAAAAGLAVASI